FTPNPGYKFAGWRTTLAVTASTKVFAWDGYEFSPPRIVVEETWTGSAAKTLYAIWELIDIPITFFPNNGEPPFIDTIKYGETVSNHGVIRLGNYTFGG
ncbi:MAG: hypothetical protein FWD09_06540, partial [Lentimicrobiaceae bacterium]|nr:hypothetical protein [Lentimicrobiaceae bacterium]